MTSTRSDSPVQPPAARRLTVSLVGLALAASCAAVPPSETEPPAPDVAHEVSGTVQAWPGEAQAPCGARLVVERFHDEVGARAGSETRALITSAQAYEEYFGHPAPKGVDLGREWVVFYATGGKHVGSSADVNVVGVSGSVLHVVTTRSAPVPPCAPTVPVADGGPGTTGMGTGSSSSGAGGAAGAGGSLGAPTPTPGQAAPMSVPPKLSDDAGATCAGSAAAARAAHECPVRAGEVPRAEDHVGQLPAPGHRPPLRWAALPQLVCSRPVRPRLHLCRARELPAASPLRPDQRRRLVQQQRAMWRGPDLLDRDGHVHRQPDLRPGPALSHQLPWHLCEEGRPAAD